jgi:hypothetical protein
VFEIVAGWVAIYPYRCTGCDHRFLRFSYAEPGPAPGTGDREIQATRRSKAWKRKRREFLLYGVGIVCFLAFLYFITRDRGGSVDGG